MKTKYFILTIDVEDWFQVENFRPWRPCSTWDSYQLRVEKNTHQILDLLDSIAETSSRSEAINPNPKPPNSIDPSSAPTQQTQVTQVTQPTQQTQQTQITQQTQKIRATFFVLGWIAERLPGLVREINSRGHEVASHGYNHIMCTDQNDDHLLSDLEDSKKILEDLTGTRITGYRAPSFAINQNILHLIRKAGYLYDSSYNSSNWNKRYGQVDLSAYPFKQWAIVIEDNFFELPISNLKINKKVFPFGGGGYFRLLPSPIFKKGVTKILKKDQAYLFYLHPWEVDVHQPRVREADFKSKFRHYLNLDKTETKLRQLIESFSFLKFVSCEQYLQEMELLDVTVKNVS